MGIFKSLKGISLIEVLVSTSLFLVFAAVFFFNFPTLNSTTTFNARINDISSGLRLMQASGSSRGGQFNNKPIGGDGIYIINSPSTNSMTFFYDVEASVNSVGVGISNKIYDTNDVMITGGVYSFKDGMFLNKIRLMLNGAWSDMPTGDRLSIVYARPNTDANIAISTNSGVFYDAVCMEFLYKPLANNLNKKSVTVAKFGQINSYDAVCN
jgi:hypothetical protein